MQCISCICGLALAALDDVEHQQSTRDTGRGRQEQKSTDPSGGRRDCTGASSETVMRRSLSVKKPTYPEAEQPRDKRPASDGGLTGNDGRRSTVKQAVNTSDPDDSPLKTHAHLIDLRTKSIYSLLLRVTD